MPKYDEDELAESTDIIDVSCWSSPPREGESCHPRMPSFKAASYSSSVSHFSTRTSCVAKRSGCFESAGSLYFLRVSRTSHLRRLTPCSSILNSSPSMLVHRAPPAFVTGVGFERGIGFFFEDGVAALR